MDLHKKTDCILDDPELPAAKKICLDKNDVSNSFRNNSSISDSTLHLGDLFSPRQSLSSCSVDDGDDNSKFSSLIHRESIGHEINISDNEDKGFNSASSATDHKSDVSNVMSVLNEADECVKIIENCQNICSPSFESNSNNLSTKAFNIDESLDFMDETCNESNSGIETQRNLVLIDVKSLTNVSEENVKVEKTICIQNMENKVAEDCNNLTNKSESDCSNTLEVTLDYTCKPDVIGEETLVLCHSTIKKDAMSPSCKLFSDPSLTSMSIDESLVSDLNNIPAKLTKVDSSDLLTKRPLISGIKFEDNVCEKICDNSGSENLFNEVSGCALDYTCSKSVGFDVNESFTDPLKNEVSETSVHAILECSNAKQKDVNMSSSVLMGCENLLAENNVNVKHENLNLKETTEIDPENPSNDLYDLSDLKNSFMSNKTFSVEEVNFLKENLLKVMELLKNDNNSFESYKLASEFEKRELLEKIKCLENNATRNHDSCAEFLNFQKAGLGENIDNSDNNIVCDELSKTHKRYNNLLQLVLVTEANWTENKLIADFLSKINFAHNELFIPLTSDGNEYVINHKKVYDLMLSLSKEFVKSISIKEECNNVLKTFLESSNMDKCVLPRITKECEEDFVVNLKATFDEILNCKNSLEKENAELKTEVCNKSDEIKLLHSTIENLNQQLNIVEETAVIPINPIAKDKYNNLTEKTHYILKEVNKNIIHDRLIESNANITDVEDSLANLNSLNLSEENYHTISLKCEKYEVELQKMRELEQVYQELLFHHNVLKTDIDSKCCEIDKLNAENKNLIHRIDDLKSRLETAQHSIVKTVDKHNEILASDDQISQVSCKNADILLPNGEEYLNDKIDKIQNNLSIKDDLVEMEENPDCLQVQCLSSKDEVLKMRMDLDCLNEKYSEALSNFDLYKQTYKHTKDEYNVWKEEKQALECSLVSIKSQLEKALSESSKLRSENDEINKKVTNLLAELSEFEITNANLRTQLNNSDHNGDVLNNEISDLKIKLDYTEKLAIDYEKKHSELKVCYDELCKDLESKKTDLSLLIDNKEKLEKELEMISQNETFLKQKIEELQENRDNLEIQFHSSKDEVSTLQSDIDCLKEKYSEMVSDFDLYKQQYRFAEDDCILLKEEKQTLECEMDSLKCQLENALEESLKLKNVNEQININLKEIENQLHNEKQSNRDIQDSYENLKIKYDESVDDINNKAIELQNLLVRIADLETTNGNLKNELNSLRCDSENNVDTTNQEVLELKIKLETSEKFLIDHEKKYEELKVSFDKICQDLESKSAELLSSKESKEKLEKELEMISQNETLLKQRIVELQENRDNLEIQFHSSKDEVSTLQSDLDCLKEKYSEILTNFNSYKETYAHTNDEFILLNDEKQSMLSELDSLKSKLESAVEECFKFKNDNEEINNNLKEMENQLHKEKQSNRDIQDSYENLKTKYEECLVEISNKTIELQNLMALIAELDTTNGNLKNELNNLRCDSENNIQLLNQELHELKTKFETSEKFLIDHEKKYDELKVSFDKICQDLESKSAELSLCYGSKEKLEKELEMISQNETLLKQKIKELQENCGNLEIQFHSSKDEVSTLQSDLECLKEKYSEMLTNFNSYKETYAHTNDEFILLNDEKQSMLSELDSLKSKLESAVEECFKFKNDNEEINNHLKEIENQLHNEKQSNRDIQDSYENLKTKYEECLVEINNKAIELQNLLTQVTELETTNGNLKTKYEESVDDINNKAIELQNLMALIADLETTNVNLKNELSNLRCGSENNIELLNRELLELKTKCETSEKLLIDHGKEYDELKVSFDQICQDLESKSAELLSSNESKEKIEKELEMISQNETLMKQKIVELQDDRNCLEVKFHSSNEEVSALKSDLDCLKEKYSEMLTNFNSYKETYAHTNDEFILLNDEKQSMFSELDSLKSKLESALEELQEVKSNYDKNKKKLEIIENQLCDEKESYRIIQISFENLKIKYDESVTVIGDKNVEIQNLLRQLSEFEANNVNLKSELNVIRCESQHNIDKLNEQVLELKGKCDISEKLFVDLEGKHNELKISYDQICEDLEFKKAEFSSLLADCKEKSEKEIDILTQNNLSLKQKLIEFEKNHEYYQKTIFDLNSQLDNANSKMNHFEVQIGLLKDKYNILSSYCSEEKVKCGEQPLCLFSEIVYAAEAMIKDLIYFKAKCSENEIKISNSQEEVSRLNILLDSLQEEIKLSAEEFGKLKENYSSLSKEHNSLLDSCKDSDIRYNLLLEKLKELESQNNLYKSDIQDLKSDVTAKESIIASLSNIKQLYETTFKENEALSSQLTEKIEKHKAALDKLKVSEENYSSLKLQCNTLTEEINDLMNKNKTLEMKCNENHELNTSFKINIEILQKEKEEIRKNFIKSEKDYQNSLDLLKKYQEKIGNLEKQYHLSISKLNVILKEKESHENQNLSLQKINDELVNRIKELNCKCQENEDKLMKLKELEKSYEIVCSKHQCLERQLLDYGNVKKENEFLKSVVSEKNSLSSNYHALNEKYSSLSDEFKNLSTAVLKLVPGGNSTMEIIKLVGEKLQAMKKIENDLEEEKMKCENLDEECNILNEDLKYKDVVIGDMYKDHSSKMNELNELLKKEENLRQELLLENSTLKDKIKCLDSEIFKLKTTEQSPCSSCAELKGVIQKLKIDLVDNSSKVTTLQLQIEENEITNKKKIHDYRKKISSLQEELGAALNKLEDNRLKNEVACLNASAQTESSPLQISGHSGIVQSFKIKEQEEKMKKYEKEILVLKRMCQSRLQTIQELKNKLENLSKTQKPQRNILEEVQNHQSS